MGSAAQGGASTAITMAARPIADSNLVKTCRYPVSAMPGILLPEAFHPVLNQSADRLFTNSRNHAGEEMDRRALAVAMARLITAPGPGSCGSIPLRVSALGIEGHVHSIRGVTDWRRVQERRYARNRRVRALPRPH